MSGQFKLGVCYYPEHWPETVWREDARRMRDMGLSWVRIGEFAWSRIEPEPGRFDWGWLDRAIDILGEAGLAVILGTPTATPPKWLVDRDPGMLAIGADGMPRKFGSRRHYCFSSPSYRRECARIVTALAERYGAHLAVQAWQTDNEFGCHDTTLSYSDAAAEAFRRWLAERYGDIAALNRAWGTVFWSQKYRDFAEIDPPNLTVTEANPSHCLDYNRFASNEVVSFNRLQADILRRLSPGRDVIHNFMGFYTEFDHFDVGRDLDVASWDSYPLGFLAEFWFSPEEKARYLRQGHPDIAAFHHDLYRACGRGHFWVMEQQPGPVNWAGFNPAPLAGMVRAWTWEAFAHGAEVVSYFRWRQAPFAQEQMHAGLNLPDFTEDVGGAEVRQVVQDIAALGPVPPMGRARVALIVSYEADWMTVIQPQGRGYRWLRRAFETYSALRALGLDVDMVEAGADLDGYALVVAPGQIHATEAFVSALEKSSAVVLLGPRSGSKTEDFQIPATLPLDGLHRLIPLRVTRVESFSPAIAEGVLLDGVRYEAHHWREHVRTDLIPIARFEENGEGAWYAEDRVHYLTTWPAPALFEDILKRLLAQAGVSFAHVPEGVRVSRRGDLVFAVNYSPEPRAVPAPEGAVFRIGERILPPAGVAVWSETNLR